MKKKKIYQYAVLWHPTEKEEEEGKTSIVIIDVTTKLASDEKSLLIQISREIPEAFMNQLDQVDIAVRPF